MYYWNPKTNEVRWDKPEGYKPQALPARSTTTSSLTERGENTTNLKELVTIFLNIKKLSNFFSFLM